jgi:hypothetical protein
VGPRPLHGPARGVHVLTALHGLGSVVCVGLALGSLVPSFRAALVLSPGSALMVGWFGPWTWAFLVAVAALLGCLSYGSFHRRRWAWPLTLAAYSVGVAGSLWEVSIGITQAWLSAAINAAVVGYALLPSVRRAYLDPSWEGLHQQP